MKRILISLVLCFLLPCTIILPQDYTRIKSIIANVSADSLSDNLKILTGEKTFSLNGQDTRITSRYRGTDGNKNAALFIKKKLTIPLLLSTTEQSLADAGKNIIARQTGTKYPKRHIILCAHFDSMPAGAISPGADDNGSGTAAVLEAARVLSKSSSENTIIYALFDQEEDNLNGSAYYANLAAVSGDTILAVINIDMVGYDPNNSNDVEIDTRPYGTSVDLANNIRVVNTECNIGLYVAIVNPGALNADQASFWFKNMPAVLMIHLADYSEYHKVTDTYQQMNIAYLTKCTKLGIAAAARYTKFNPLDGVNSIKEIPVLFTSLEQNYPNPFNPATVIKYKLNNSGSVKLSVYDVLGREVKNLVNEYQSAGEYSTSFDARGMNLTSGIYFYTLQSGSNVISKKMVLLK